MEELKRYFTSPLKNALARIIDDETYGGVISMDAYDVVSSTVYSAVDGAIINEYQIEIKYSE